MFTRKSFIIFVAAMLLSQHLLAQIVLQGVVKNNGDEPVADALVEVIDQANANRTFSSTTNNDGQYSIDISITGIGGAPGQKPRSFNLLQNYPNPFNPSTIISYEIPHPAHVQIEIYNVLGQRIKTLLDANQTNLYGRVMWDGTNDQGRGVSAGVYFYTLVSEGHRITHKMLLLDGHLGNTAAAATPQQGNTAPGSLLKPQSFTFLLKVSGTDIETWEQHDVVIDESREINVTVNYIVTDIDGNVYHTVKIGNQWWMTENLKVTRYRSGILIPNIMNDNQWSKTSSGARCSYNNDTETSNTFGFLYNWAVITDSRNLTPEGWQVPKNEDWVQLERTIGLSMGADEDLIYWHGNNEGGKLKEAGTQHWASPNYGATDSIGFSALPAGCRNPDGSFENITTDAFFWTSTTSGENQAKYLRLNTNHADIYREYYNSKAGYSIRCVRYCGNPTIPVLSTPENETTGLYTSVTVTWKISAGAEWYGVQVATDSIFTTLVVNDDSISTTTDHITGLEEGTAYYWRVNASNPNGTSEWSRPGKFSTAVYETGTVTDNEGNIYKTVLIGNQWWMAENLKLTHYNNGDEIPCLTDFDEWHNTNISQSGAWCNYLNKEENNAIYGHLYNWYVVNDERGITPEGWKVPTDNEWKEMETLLGMKPSEEDSTWIIWFNVSGKLRETGTLHWKSPNLNATNESGFTALPGGERNSNGNFYGLGESSTFWTSTSDGGLRAIHRRISEWSEINNRTNQSSGGCSIRLMKYATQPNAPIPVLIENGEYDVTTSPILRWRLANGALTYGVQVAMNPDFSTLIVNQSNIDSTSFQMTNLLPGTTFYWRVNAGNTEGTSPWSEPWSFTTLAGTPVTGTVTDIDGNVYKTVRIGKQWWMAENLKTTHYSNGDPIPNITDSTAWIQLFTGAMCNWKNDPGSVATFGSLYNWFATVDERNIAPEGWHVPTDEDWKQLERHLGVDRNEVDYENWRGTNAGGMLKEAGTSHWNEPNTGSTNETGFTALSCGFRSYLKGNFTEPGTNAYFLTATETDSALAVVRSLNYNSGEISIPRSHKLSGFSVRCVKD